MNASLNNRWTALEKERIIIGDILQTASLPQQRFRKEPDSWNMLQIMAHLIAVEKTGFDFLISKNYGNARKPKGKFHLLTSFLLRILLRSPLRFKVPPIPSLVPSEEKSLEALTESWKNEREKMKNYLENFPENKLNHLIFKHPSAGRLTIEQTLSFLVDHIKHHHQQIARLKKAPEFPD